MGSSKAHGAEEYGGMRLPFVPLTCLAAVSIAWSSLLGIPSTCWATGGPASGDLIAFLREGDVWTMQPDGTAQTKLTSSGDVGYLVWSPGGMGIGFGRPNAIWVMDRNGRGQRLVAETDYREELYERTYRLLAIRGGRSDPIRLVPTFAWLPDGRRLAFASPHQVCRVDLATGRTTTLTSFREGWCDEVACSRDGRLVAFAYLRAMEYPGYEERLYLLDLRSGKLRSLFHYTGGPGSERQVVSLAFSPDGKRLTYSDIPHTVMDGRISVVDLTTFRTTTPPRDPATAGKYLRSYYFPAGAPDGQCLAARYMDFDGSYYTGVAVYSWPRRQWRYWPHVHENYTIDLSFSPDGRQLVFTHWPEARPPEEPLGGPPEVYLLNLSDGSRRKIADKAEMPCWRPATHG